MPPGTIAREQISRGVPLRGYVQPVEIRVPPGAEVSIASNGDFYPFLSQLKVGLTLGYVYRLKVTNIPRTEGGEVYPTVEVINRLYPPRGKKDRFPVPIEIAQDELEMALSGKMVVRVIYLENPNEAFPVENDPDQQRYVEVLPGEDPLRVADELGRPMAILRMGSRLPPATGADSEFLFGSPPVTIYAKPIVEDSSQGSIPKPAAVDENDSPAEVPVSMVEPPKKQETTPEAPSSMATDTPDAHESSGVKVSAEGSQE